MATIDEYNKNRNKQLTDIDKKIVELTSKVSALETASEKTDANVDYIAMMTDVELEEVVNNAQ